MEYRGFKYDPYWETEADGHNKKLWHVIHHPDGKSDFHPEGRSYQYLSREEIEDYIDEILKISE